jgi:hypothetical protein
MPDPLIATTLAVVVFQGLLKIFKTVSERINKSSCTAPDGTKVDVEFDSKHASRKSERSEKSDSEES